MDESSAKPQVFRPYRVLAWMMAGAGILWTVVLAYLLTFDGVPLKTLASAVFFVLMFGVALAYYGRTAILVDRAGITVRGLLRTRRVPFTEIRKVDVLPGPLTVYAIRGRRVLIHFTSFFQQHQSLMKLVRQGAKLGQT